MPALHSSSLGSAAAISQKQNSALATASALTSILVLLRTDPPIRHNAQQAAI